MVILIREVIKKMKIIKDRIVFNWNKDLFLILNLKNWFFLR